MDAQMLISALEQQRNNAMNQNVELIVHNMLLQKEITELKKKLADTEEKN